MRASKYLLKEIKKEVKFGCLHVSQNSYSYMIHCLSDGGGEGKNRGRVRVSREQGYQFNSL